MVSQGAGQSFGTRLPCDAVEYQLGSAGYDNRIAVALAIGVSSARREFVLEYRNGSARRRLISLSIKIGVINRSIVDDIARRDVDSSMSYCNRVAVYWTWRRATIDFVEYWKR